MSCIPTTSTEYSTTRQTLFTEIWTTSTRSIPIVTAITTSDGQVFTPVRVVEVSSAYEVTTVVASLVPARTVVVECTSNTTPSASPSTVVAPSSSSTMSSGSVSTVAPFPTSSVAAITSAVSTTSSAPPSPESTGTSLTTTITLTVPPSSSAPAPPTASSSLGNITDSAGAFVPQAAEEELSKGTIGGLAAGGVGLFLLILAALWFVQRQFGKDSRGRKSTSSERGARSARRRRGQESQGGNDDFVGMRDEGLSDLVSEKMPVSDRPPPLLPPVMSHTRWSAITLPPTFRQPASTRGRGPASFDLPQHPPVSIPFGSSSFSSSSTKRSLAQSRHSSVPLNLHHSGSQRPGRGPAISPTPAVLDRQERADRPGSVWNRLSGLMWRMSWSLPSPTPIQQSLIRTGSIKTQSHTGLRDTSATTLTSVDLPTTEIRGSARVGRIPSMVDLREIDIGIQAVSGGEAKSGSSSRTGSGVSTPRPHLAPARPSSEYIREEDKPVEATLPGGIPPPPMRSNSLVRNQYKRSTSAKSRDNEVEQKGSRTLSDRAVSSSQESMSGRTIAGNTRWDVPSNYNLRSSRGTSSGETTRRSGSIHSNSDSPFSSPYQDLQASSAYAQPGLYTISTQKHHRRPPSLTFAKEVSMPRLWIHNQSIAVINPDSSYSTQRETTDSAYDGMTEVDLPPLSAVRKVPPRTMGREGDRKGLPELPTKEMSASSSFKGILGGGFVGA